MSFAYVNTIMNILLINKPHLANWKRYGKEWLRNQDQDRG